MEDFAVILCCVLISKNISKFNICGYDCFIELEINIIRKNIQNNEKLFKGRKNGYRRY